MLAWEIVIVSVGLLLLNICLRYVTVLRTIYHHPGLLSILPKASFVPRLWGFSHEKTITWLQKHKVFEKYGWDIVPSTSMLPTPATALFVADPGAIKEISVHRSRFPKLMKEYSILSLFGPNIVVSENLDWKRYRKLLAPAFSQENIKIVWEETFHLLHDIQQKWNGQDSVTIENPAELAFGIALHVISITGFGVHLDNMVLPNHKLSFGDALRCVATDSFIKLTFPDWIPGFIPRVRKFRLAYAELQKYMEEIVHAKQHGGEVFIRDGSLLSNLINAWGKEGFGNAHLTQDELFGNTFISFFAGQETTTHTMAFTLILLAIHPSEQDLLYQQIRDVWDGKNIPPWNVRAKLTRVVAVLNETLRMFPSITGLPRYSLDACVLKTCSASSLSEHQDVPVPRGTSLVIDIPGVHYNDKYWPDPYTFKPDRFLGSWCEDAFLPFSAGGRSCLGRDFAETELIATFTSLLSTYKIELHPDLAGLDSTSLMRMVADVIPGLTLCPKPFPLVFKRRSSI